MLETRKKLRKIDFIAVVLIILVMTVSCKKIYAADAMLSMDSIKNINTTGSTWTEVKGTANGELMLGKIKLTKPAYVRLTAKDCSKYSSFYVYDSTGVRLNGNVVSESSFSGQDKTETYKVYILKAGTYTISLKQLFDGGDITYNIAKKDISEYASKNLFKNKAVSLELNKNVKDFVSGGQTKWFKFTVKDECVFAMNLTVREGKINQYWGTSATVYKGNKKIANITTLKKNFTVSSDAVKLSKGTYYVEIDCSKTGAVEYTFKANLVQKPCNVKVSSKKAKQMTVNWTKMNNCKQYEVQYSADKKFKKGVKSVRVNGTTTTIKNLKRDTTYYVRVRARAKVSEDVTIKSPWTSRVTVNVK